MNTIIIGKQSNLSIELCRRITQCHLVSARDIEKNINALPSLERDPFNLVFNNFQPATQLHLLGNVSDYVTNSILVTAKVLNHYKNQNIQKIIYTSSSSVYGNNILCNENDELKPMNLHASLKVANEKLIEKFSVENSIDYTITRTFNMYGGDDHFSVVSKILDAYRNDKELTIVNNGNAIRDFIHIDDVVSVYLKLLEIEGVKVINVGTGEGSSIKSILTFLSNRGIKINTQNIFRDELKTSTADIQLLSQVTGKEDFIGIEEYLKKELSL